MRRALAIAALAATALVGAPASEAIAKQGVKVKVQQSRFGKVLMNGGGKALYLFSKDRKGPSKCYGPCATAWPPFITKGKPVAGKGVKGRKLGTTKRSDGRRQVTYGGHPVYFYVDDSPGVILCQDVFEFGGRWLLLDAAGKAVR
ncbi:MAG: hypothetical protein F9K44_13360 [Hyphomicrobiaceae bacterium]|nr:MAG: hypothetical protein F9K44_13360 [Hyphomicrobiaceae bacterium]